MSFNAVSVLKDPDIMPKTVSTIHNTYIVVSADKTQINIVFVCKTHYIQCLLMEVDFENCSSNKTYTATMYHILHRRDSAIL